MRYIKPYDNLPQQFKIGDNVIANEDFIINGSNPNIIYIMKFLKNNVGKVYKVKKYKTKKDTKIFYYIKYEYAPENIKFYALHKIYPFSYSFRQDELRTATKMEVEMQKIKDYTEKYNL